MEPICPQCHVPVRPTDFFCYNCGKNLKPQPLSTGFGPLAMYYLGAIVLPPMGIIWGIKYMREQSQSAKIHGVLLISITVIEIIVLTVWTINFLNGIQAQANGQLNGLQGL